MPTVLLVRHGRTNANATGLLAGWTPGIGLDETGRTQAKGLAERLAAVPLAAAVVSPLQRCQETAQLLLDAHPRTLDGALSPVTDERLGECKYGDWTGRPLKELAEEPLWKVVQAHASAVTFPGEHGESIPQMQTRAVTAIREHDARIAAEHGDDAVWLAVSHGDVIKSILADALGMHLDAFQRLVADPCSVSVVRYTRLRPFALRVNDVGGDLSGVVPPARPKGEPADGPTDDAEASSDAVVGGSHGGSHGADVRP
ncbi:histidine phosphatase family protein [Spongisporangium articulatum]|uniref:Histidine phosphatase family protein n=1 Tax=Spongisporangium articulatum TaxID=3362603 RepID=A0ABW8ARW6_9ACTN